MFLLSDGERWISASDVTVDATSDLIEGVKLPQPQKALHPADPSTAKTREILLAPPFTSSSRRSDFPADVTHAQHGLRRKPIKNKQDHK